MDHARGMSNRQDRSMAVRTGMQIITGDLVRSGTQPQGLPQAFEGGFSGLRGLSFRSILALTSLCCATVRPVYLGREP